MTKYFIKILPFLLIVFYSCQDIIYESKDLEGEWISTTNSRTVFSFKSDKCSYFSPTGNFAHYIIDGNQLIITDSIKRRKKLKVKKYKFSIDRLDDDNLTLITDSITLKTQFKYSNPSEYDTFELQKLNPNFVPKYSKFEFESSQCYGTCPSMKLVIDSSGNITYEGRAYTERNGFYSGKLSTEQINSLKRKLGYLNLGSLKTNYSAMWTDDQTCKFEIHLEDTILKTRVYGFTEEPLELRILFNELMEMYKLSELKQDSLHKYYFDDFE